MLRARDGSSWAITPIAGGRGARARRDAVTASTHIYPSQFLADGVTVAEAAIAEPTPGRRTVGITTLDIEAEVTDEASYLLVARHPSGALTFHRSETPSFENPDLDVKLAYCEQWFDDDCLELLKSDIPEDLHALQSMLRVFEEPKDLGATKTKRRRQRAK